MADATLTAELLASLGGRVRRVRGHHPLVLDDTRMMWLIAEGSAAVLTSRVEHGLPVGSRRLLFRASPGTPLFSVSDGQSESSNRLIVLSIEPLTLYEIPIRRVDQALAAIGLPLVQAIETWVEKLSVFAADGLEPPAGERMPGEGKFALPPGTVLRGEPNAVTWLRVDDGDLHLLGLPQLRIGKLPLFVPVGPRAWLTTDAPVRLVARRAASIGDPRQLVRGLALFNSLFQARLRHLEDAEHADELARLARRARLEQGLVESAVGSMAAVLNPADTPQRSESALLAAARLVGNALDSEVRAPPAGDAERPGRQAVEAIARASHLKFRRVLLSGEWWKSDCGPLLGELEDGARPVALLRDEGRGYFIVDPEAGTRTRVDANTSLSLAPQAVMLYRRLPDDARSPWDLVRFSMRGRGGDLAFIIVLALATTLLGMITPQATAVIMDTAIPDANERLLIEIGLGLLAATVGIALFGLAQSIVTIRVGIGTDAVTQPAVWDRLLNLRMSFFKRFASGDLLSRAMAVSEVNHEFNGQTMRTLLAGFMSLLNLGLLYYYSARLAMVAVALGLVVGIASVIAGLFIRRHYRELMELQGHFFGLVVQLVSAVSKIRVAGAQRRAFALWARRYSEQLSLTLRAQQGEDYTTLLNQAVPVISSMLLFWFGVQMLGGGAEAAQQGGQQSAAAPALTVGIFLAFNTAMGTFLSGATSLSYTLLDTLDTLAKARRMRPLLEAEAEVDDSKVNPGRLDGEIEISHVDFRYDPEGEKILDDVSLKVSPGEFVAFTGPSGSGKSTVFRLLLGFETPEAGAVYYDGRDLAGLDVMAVRRQLGVVLQSGRINAGSIFDNVASGAPLSLDQVWEAVEDAGFRDDVTEMPMGLHTVISEGGTNLSGGQRQRLLIARALAMHPKVLLLDEATSALDNRTQAIVSASLERRKVTRLVIAHRLSTIRNADRIYVLDRGRVVETGSFDELLAQRGVFASMIARQVA